MYLREAAPLAELSEEQLLQLAQAACAVETTRNEVLVREGSIGSSFFIVLRGDLGVFQKEATTLPCVSYTSWRLRACEVLPMRPQRCLQM